MPRAEQQQDEQQDQQQDQQQQDQFALIKNMFKKLAATRQEV